MQYETKNTVSKKDKFMVKNIETKRNEVMWNEVKWNSLLLVTDLVTET